MNHPRSTRRTRRVCRTANTTGLVLLLSCVLAISGCASSGVRPSPIVQACPVLTPPSAPLMQPSNAGKTARDELLAPPSNATPKSQPSKRGSGQP